ncbi:MAG: HXXEE domain-containing protein [Pseudomonadota bacterium]
MTHDDRRSLNDLGGAIALLIGFAMLWLPLGQHEFLAFHWMKLGTFMAPFLLLAAFSFRAGKGLGDPQFIALAILLAYIAHQFEEHWIDLFGNVFAFQGSVNDLIGSALGVYPASGSAPEVLTRMSVFVVNTSLVWLVGALAIWRGRVAIFPVLAIIAIALVNSVSHIMSGLAMGGYNPGLLTSALLFLPLCLLSYVSLWRDGYASIGQIGLSLVWSLLAHVILVLGAIAANWWNLFPEIVYFALLILWSAVPTVGSWRDRAGP